MSVSAQRTFPLSPGTQVDSFRVLRLVGRGGMGEIYLARDTRLGRKVALKVVRPEALGDARAVQRFLVEARVTARFSHPHIVAIHEVGELGDCPYVALEYLEGRTLRQRLEAERPSVKECLRVGLAIAQALEEAHAHGVLHRDLKPENVIIPKDGRLRVLDFGLAKVIGRTADSAVASAPTQREPSRISGSRPSPVLGPSTARDGSLDDTVALVSSPPAGPASDAPDSSDLMVGTPAYMAPEQWLCKETTPATDLWAWGVILYEMLSGRHPFDDGSVLGMRLRVIGPDAAPPMDMGQDVPEALADWVSRCLDKDPSSRPRAREVVGVLRDLLDRDRGPVDVEASPFRGLLAFTERHADSFFGRGDDVAAFVERLRSEPVLAVVGPSGAGKSSFVQAGVIPRLREAGRWRVLSVRPGRTPLDALVSVLLSRETDAGVSTSRRRSTKDSLRPPPDQPEVPGRFESMRRELGAEPRSLLLKLDAMADRQDANVLLFVDQLEELYTLVHDEQERRQFMEAVCTAADDPEGPVRVVFTVRDDFLGRLAETDAARAALSHVTVLRSPGVRGLREILLRPVERVGYRFEDSRMVDEMVRSVASEPGCLPVLQCAANQLWTARDRRNRVLPRAAFEGMQGLEGALARHADAVLDGLPTEQVRIARKLLLRLVTPSGTRRVIARSDLLAGLSDHGPEVLHRLVEGRIVQMRKARRRDDDADVELVHESLIHRWQRLARWVDEAREEIAFLTEASEAAALWERRGCRPDEAWRAEALHDALRKAAAVEHLPLNVEAFLRAGLSRERASTRRKRYGLIVGFAVLVAVTVVLAVQNREARRQRQAAEQQRLLAEARQAESLREGARAALARGNVLEARAKLRSAFELEDDPAARALLRHLRANPLRWKMRFGVPPLAVAISPDGTTVACAGQDGLVTLADARSREPRRLRGHTDQLYAVDFSPDGLQLVASTWGGEIGLWDLATGRPKRMTKRSGVWTVRWAPDGRSIGVAGVDGKVLLVDADTGQPRGGLALHDGAVRSVAFSPDGRWLASGGLDERMHVVPVGGGEARCTLDDHAAAGVGVAFDATGSRVADTAKGNAVRVTDVASCRVLQVLRGHEAAVRSVTFSPRDDRLASASDDGTIRVWKLGERATSTVLGGHGNAVREVRFGPTGRFLASVGADGTLRYWDTHARAATRFEGGHQGASWDVVFSPDGSRLASVSQDRTLRLWDVTTGALQRVVEAHEATVSTVAFAPAGDRVATGGDDAKVKIWSLDTAERAKELTGHESGIWDLAFSRDGRVLVSGASDGTIRVWDPTTGATRQVLRGHREAVYAVALTPDGKRVVSGSQDSTVRLWDLASGRTIRTFADPEASVWGVAVDPTGRFVAVGAEDGKARWWPLAGGPGRVVHEVDARLYWVDVHPDGRRVGLPASDGVVRIVDVQNGTIVPFYGHRREVGTVRFSADGRLAATASDDGTVRLWEVSSGRPRWRAPMLRTEPLSLLTHAGWKRLEGEGREPASKWADAARDRALQAKEADGLVCIATVEGAVELWDTAADALLVREKMQEAAQVAVSPDGCLVRSRAGRVRWFPREGPSGPVADQATAIGSVEGGFGVAEERRLRLLAANGSSGRRFEVDLGVSSLATVGQRIALGYADGNVDLLDPSTGERRSLMLERTPSSHTTVLSSGPPGTLLLGFADGQLGLWSLADGARLDQLRLHGAVVHLAWRGERVVAASELGDVGRMDLGDFHRPYCELVREVWEQTRVVWASGRAREQAPPGEHRCAR